MQRIFILNMRFSGLNLNYRASLLLNESINTCTRPLSGFLFKDFRVPVSPSYSSMNIYLNDCY